MKVNYFVVSILSLILVCVVSCKNNSSDKASDDNNSDSIQANVKADNNGTEVDGSVPLLSAAELAEIYDNFDDTHYFENHFSDKGMKQLDYDDYKNQEDVPDDSWVTEVWGYNMSYDKSIDDYGKRFTSENDDALAVVLNYTDDPNASIYFYNPAYQDIYIKQLGELGFKHFEGDDEFGVHFDVYAKDGYKPGEIDKVFTLTQEGDVFVLDYAYM